jgi:RNA polymerase sigma factor (sigma-70 family)
MRGGGIAALYGREVEYTRPDFPVPHAAGGAQGVFLGGERVNDWELLRQYVQTRSQPAFAQLVERHVRWVHAACARHVRDAHLAEDVTQSVFLLLSQKAARLKPQTSITGWLFRAARLMSSNAMKMQRRRIRRDTRAAVAAAQDAGRSRQGAAESSSPSLKNESELIEAIDTAMVRLRAPDRDVLLLRFYGNKSVAEAASELEISIDAAKKRFARSLDALRQALTDQGVALPAVGRRDDDLSAVAPTASHAVPAALSAWIAAGATPATVSARAAAIVQWAGMRKLLTATLAATAIVLILAVAGIYAWPMRPSMPAVAAAVRARPDSMPTPSPPATIPAIAAPVAVSTTTTPPTPSVQRFAGHSTWIVAASISADGRSAASRSSNQLLRWDLAAGAAIGQPFTIREQPIGLAISPAGRIVAVDRSDLLVFDTFDAAAPRRLPPKEAKTMHWSLAISSKGDHVAAGGADGVIRIIDVASGDQTAALRGHAGVVSVIAFSPDDHTLLSGGWDHTVRLWDVAAAKELHRFDEHTSAIYGVAFSSDGNRAITFARSLVGPKSRSAADPMVRIWDLTSTARHLMLPVPTPTVHAAALTPDGQRAIALVDKELFVWDLAAGEGRLVDHHTVLPGTTVVPTCAEFSADGRQLIVGGDGKMRNGLLTINLGDATTTTTRPTRLK